MKEFAIIVAGGSGSRMKQEVPKQFLELKGRPILMHTVEAFINYSSNISIILVLPEEAISTWYNLCTQYAFTLPVTIATGGTSRYQSVKNGLKLLPEEDLVVAIHDGVRPFVSKEIIANSFETARTHGSAIAAMPLKESIAEVEGDSIKSIDRSMFRSIQTPQTFRGKLIKEAYENIGEDAVLTDDASVAARNGAKIRLIEGSYENIKITTPEDLLFAESILGSKK